MMDLRDHKLSLLAELHRRRTGKFRTYFPDTGVLARSKYPRHTEFFAAGQRFAQRLFMAANRVGKSEAGAYEVTCHLTGLYPPWWEGKRFDHPVEVWVCGTTSETTRDIVQTKLFGDPQNLGTTWTGGMVPEHLIVNHTRRVHGLANSLESVWVTHVSGDTSVVGLKTYEQGRKSFEGTAKHVIWCDEEPPEDCYTEMVFRTMTTKGIVLVTFTPLQGRSHVVNGFLEPTPEAAEHKWFIQAGWNHVPHLDATQKTALLATTPPHEVKARSEGEPTLGAGAIYPIEESNLIVPTRIVPSTWRRCYGMDIGWRRTAVIWGAEDPSSGAIELYDEHYLSQGEPPSHAAAIHARGEWMHGVIDPASAGASVIDGRVALDLYRDLGLNLEPAVNAVEAGLLEVWTRMVTGRLRVQLHLANWLAEFRKYHRDPKGKIVKENDHLMDATRYLVMSGEPHMRTPPQLRRRSGSSGGGGDHAWMGG
ncbi:MAG: hypothetical protein FJ271_25970 [Planctomycetes bacterium]|nr:hypothetical protein [Planctomycetota bacterium]